MTEIHLGPDDRQAIYDAVFSAMLNDPQIRQAIHTGAMDGIKTAHTGALQAQLAEANKRVEELETELAFYGDEGNWRSHEYVEPPSEEYQHGVVIMEMPLAEQDRGQRARAAIGGGG